MVLLMVAEMVPTRKMEVSFPFWLLVVLSKSKMMMMTSIDLSCCFDFHFLHG